MKVSLGYDCRAQFAPFHVRKQRWACLVAHRRAGKTVACVADIIDDALRCDKPDPRFAYIAPLYVQAKDVAWAYVKRFTAPIPGVQFNEAELRVDLPHNGARIRLYGADNYDRMRGIYLDGAVLDEFADFPPPAWTQVIRPALSDRQGRATFIGTPKGRNSFHELYEYATQHPNEWFAAMLKASQTGLLLPEELADNRAQMTPETYEQEFECSFEAAILGAYYGREIAQAEREGRITTVPYEPDLPVYTAWDLGKHDATAIWFWQAVGTEIRVIDFYERAGEVMTVHARERMARYRVDTDYVPHDAKVVEYTGDGRSRVEAMQAVGLKPRLVLDHKIMDGINAARVLLPRMVFDAERCKDGLEALRQYRTDYDEKARAFRLTPKHDWTSHAADAFRYMAMAYKQERPPAVAQAPGTPKGITDMTWNQLMDRQKPKRKRI